MKLELYINALGNMGAHESIEDCYKTIEAFGYETGGWSIGFWRGVEFVKVREQLRNGQIVTYDASDMKTLWLKEGF